MTNRETIIERLAKAVSEWHMIASGIGIARREMQEWKDISIRGAVGFLNSLQINNFDSMSTNIKTCPFTGQDVEMYQPNARVMEYLYETETTGKILISDVALSGANNLGNGEKQIIRGLARNSAIRKEAPYTISYKLYSQLNNQDIPYGFDARVKHLLKYLYDHGGKEYVAFELSSERDSAISYSSRDEFERIIKCLVSEGWIIYNNLTATKNTYLYHQVQITRGGIQEIEKGQPVMPLIHIVNASIKTGTPDIDAKIEHAKRLFFEPPSSLDHKRSACETLSFVIEGYRKELSGIFHGDTEIFFQIVNQFHIRHNNNKTKAIEHEEQLEWIFYGLLNTVHTYVKMKKKLG